MHGRAGSPQRPAPTAPVSLTRRSAVDLHRELSAADDRLRWEASDPAVVHLRRRAPEGSGASRLPKTIVFGYLAHEPGIRFPETCAVTIFRQAYSARAGGIRPSALAACRLIEGVGQVAELGELE